MGCPQQRHLLEAEAVDAGGGGLRVFLGAVAEIQDMNAAFGEGDFDLALPAGGGIAIETLPEGAVDEFWFSRSV